MADPRIFVKSRDTSTSAVNSRAQIDKMLRRYGASAIAMSEDVRRREIIVTFVVPNSSAKDAHDVPVKLPVSIYEVYHALYGRPTRLGAYTEKQLAQAERVAWRNLVLWIDAALSAASVGLQTITEAFFAHAIVGPSGERMIEVVEHAQQSLGGGVQRLLTATTQPQP